MATRTVTIQASVLHAMLDGTATPLACQLLWASAQKGSTALAEPSAARKIHAFQDSVVQKKVYRRLLATMDLIKI
jgi:hypothetical protein